MVFMNFPFIPTGFHILKTIPTKELMCYLGDPGFI